MGWERFAESFPPDMSRAKAVGPCPHGKRMKRLVADLRKRNLSVTDPDEALAGLELIDAGMAYCIARCGGCELTKDWSPPSITRP